MECVILYAATEAYVVPLAASVASLTSTSCGRRARIVVLDGGISAESRRRLQQCACRSWTLTFSEMPTAWTDHLPDPGRFSRASYGRLFVDRIADGASRIIYLDADTLVVRALDPLIDLDLGGNPVAAVRDEYVPVFGAHAQLCTDAAVAGSAATPYLNSGVLVIDPVEWTRRGVAQRAARFLGSASDTLEYPDQDALNVALLGAWTELPAEWNVGRYWYRSERRIGPYRDICNRVRILHYTTEYKPWLRPQTVPEWANAPFFASLARTPWSQRSQPPLLDGPRREDTLCQS